MQSISELELYEMPTEDKAMWADPAPQINRAREVHPWLSKSHAGYVVHDYKAIRDLMALEKTKLKTEYDGVVRLMGGEGTPWGRFTEEGLLGAAPEPHKRVRSLMAPYFTPRQANLHRPLMREVILKQLDEWAPRGEFDFEEFASWFPINVMVRLIGADPAMIPELRWSMDQIGLAFTLDRSLLPKLQEAILNLDEAMMKLVEDRRAKPRIGQEPDLLDVMLQATATGEMLDRELYDMLITLFVAGYDTSKNVLTLIMYDMIKNPKVYERCAIDHEYCGRVVEETLRFHNPSIIWRSTTEDVVYRDVLIPAGTLLYFMVNFAGRDSSHIVEPDVYNPDGVRAQGHMGFGMGVHICLGQYIARAQIQEGLFQIAQRMKNPRLNGEIAWKPFIGLWGAKGLQIKFDPVLGVTEAVSTERA